MSLLPPFREAPVRYLLALGFAAYVVYAALDFVSHNPLKEIAKLRTERDQVQENLAAYAALSNLFVGADRKLMDVAAAMRGVVTDQIVPADSAFSWTSLVLKRHAARYDVNIQALSPIEDAVIPWQVQDQPGARLLVPYAVRFETNATMEQFLNMIASLEKENPFLAITSVTLLPPKGSSTARRINFVAEWPAWAATAEAAKLRAIIMAAH